MTASPPGLAAGSAATPMHRRSTGSGVTVAVYAHQESTGSGPLGCVSFVSEGMARFGQKEVVITLPVSVAITGAQVSEEPFHLLDTIASLAAQGRTVDVGSITQFGARSPFGKHIVYARAQTLTGVPVSPAMLTVLFVSEEELQSVGACGLTRLLSRIGAACSWFPFPSCLDPMRPGLPMAETVEQSILARMPHTFVAEVRATQTHEALWLVLPARPLPALQVLTQLPPQAPFALFTELDPAADACLTWVPGQTSPAAISPPGSTGSSVGGTFLAVNGDQPEDTTQIFEDGFICSLTPATWLAVCQALLSQRALAVPARHGLPLRIHWQ